MKIFYIIFLLAFSFSACKKDFDNSNCKLIEAVTYNSSGNIIEKTTYDYDIQGRVSKIVYGISGHSSFVINYHIDSIVITDNSGRVISYYLKNGKIDSSYYGNPTAPQQWEFCNNYTYDLDGFVIAERQINNFLQNGATVSDTTYKNYTIQNGNITRISYTYWTNDEIYEYSNATRPENNPALSIVDQSIPGVLIKLSKNLVNFKKSPSGEIHFQYSYSNDKRGNITEMIISLQLYVQLNEIKFENFPILY
jgi:hypothetical protein